MLPLLLQAGCSLFGPTDADFVFGIEHNEPDLTEVRVQSTRWTSPGWYHFTGSAKVRHDLYAYRPPAKAAALCEPTVPGDALTKELDGRKVYQRMARAGDAVSLGDLSGAPSPAAPGDPVEKVSPNGYVWGAWGGNYRLGDEPDFYLGDPEAEIEGFAQAVIVGTPGFAELCERASNPGAPTEPPR